MTTAATTCPACEAAVEVNSIEPVQWARCFECGCGAWLRVELIRPAEARTTHWADDVFLDEADARSKWPMTPWRLTNNTSPDTTK